jgi:outer membrane receptor protein involved in Fe transport
VGAVPESVQVIDREAIERSAAATLPELLSQVAGAPLTDEQGAFGQMSFSVRGLVASPVTGLPQGVSVFVDGVRVNEPTVEEINFDLLPLGEVESIEIVRGPGRLSGRNTLGAAINVVTRRAGGPREGGAAVAFGSFLQQRYRAWLSGRAGGFDGYLAASHTAERGFRDEARSRVSYLFGKVGYRDGGTDLTLSHQLQLDRIEEPGSLPASVLGADRRRNYSGGDFFKPTLNLTTLTARRQEGDRWAVVGTGYLRLLAVEQFNVNRVGEDSRLFGDTTSTGALLQLYHAGRWRWLRSRLVAGAELTHNRVAVQVQHEGDAATVSAQLSDSQLALGTSLQERLTVGEEALGPGRSGRLSLGVRADRLTHHILDTSPGSPGKASGDASFSRVTPAAALTFDTPYLAISASYAQGFRAPAFLELTCSDPTSPCVGLQAGVAPDTGFGNLRPVRARDYELGVTARPLTATRLQLVAFRMDLRDDIFSVAPANTVEVYFQNVGDTRRQGVELQLEAAAGPLRVTVGYTFTEATFLSALALPSPRTPGTPEMVAAGREIPLVPRHRASASLSWQPWSVLTVGAQAAFTGPQWLRGDEANTDRRLAAYTLLNAHLTVSYRRCAAFGRASNLLGVRHETFGTYAPNALLADRPIERFLTPGLPVSVLGGVSCRIGD